MKPAPIVYVVKRYPRFSETFIVNEILAHEAAGWEVEIVSLYPPNDSHFQDTISRVRAPVWYCPADGLRAAEFWSGLRAAGRGLPGFWAALGTVGDAEPREVYQAALLALRVRERGLGHLHAHFASTAAEVARLAARFAEVPYTVTAHAKDIFHESVEPGDLRRKFREAAAVVTVSDFNVRHLRERLGDDARGVTRLYNGLDLGRFPYSSPELRPPHVVGVGRLIEKKGFGDLLEACARLAARGVEFTATIIGTGEQETQLRARLAELGLGGRVELAGAQPQKRVIAEVGRAAVFAAPCVVGRDGNADGLPTVLLEAMALGTPCVSTPVTGIPEAIRHGHSGWLVPERDPAALADALERLLGDGSLRARLAGEARRLVESEFEVHRNAGRLREIFRQAAVLGSPATGPGVAVAPIS